MTLYEQGYVDYGAGVKPKMTTGDYATGYESAREETEEPKMFECGFVTFKHYRSAPGIMELHLDDKSGNREDIAINAMHKQIASVDCVLLVNQETAWIFAGAVAREFEARHLDLHQPD